MKYLFMSSSGDSLSLARRLQDEGGDVGYYIHNPRYAENYDGVLPKLPMKALPGYAKKADLVIFDMTCPVEHKRDRALHKVFGVKGDSLFGPIADNIRKSGGRALGSSALTDRLELDREFGSKMAEASGLTVPKTKRFSSLLQGARFLEGREDLWAFKPCENQDLDLTYVEKNPGELTVKLAGEYRKRLPENVTFILQEKIDGVELSTEAWWTGSDWTLFNHTVEDKTLMNDDLGPRIGSANNTVWLKEQKDGLMRGVFDELTPFVQQTGYVGPIDINSIVSAGDKKTYFLEWTPRLGYDAIYCLLAMLAEPVTVFIEHVTGRTTKPEFKTGYGSSVRVSIPPYPYETPELLDMAKGVQITGRAEGLCLEDVRRNGTGYICTGADGVIGVAAAHGNTIKESARNVYRRIGEVQIGAYPQYRTDCGQRAERAIATLKKWGLAIH